MSGSVSRRRSRVQKGQWRQQGRLKDDAMVCGPTQVEHTPARKSTSLMQQACWNLLKSMVAVDSSRQCRHTTDCSDETSSVAPVQLHGQRATLQELTRIWTRDFKNTRQRACKDAPGRLASLVSKRHAVHGGELVNRDLIVAQRNGLQVRPTCQPSTASRLRHRAPKTSTQRKKENECSP